MTDRHSDGATRADLRVLGAEAVATALLMVGGLTAVILVVSPTGPLAGLDVPDWVRRFVAGGLFGLSGTAATLSRWGRLSGAHLNPAVTLAFRLEGTISTARAAGYVLAQLTGALVGAAVVRLWGPWGRGVSWGTTVPKAGLAGWQAAGLEAGVTLVLVVLVLSLVARPRVRHLTPWTMGPLVRGAGGARGAADRDQQQPGTQLRAGRGDLDLDRGMGLLGGSGGGRAGRRRSAAPGHATAGDRGTAGLRPDRREGRGDGRTGAGGGVTRGPTPVASKRTYGVVGL